MSFVQVGGVHKNFGKTEILRGIDFSLEEGEHCIIKGASGSGKSTFLYLLGGLERFEKGSINIGGKSLDSLNDAQLAAFRNRDVGFVFQFHFLLSSLTCLENILLPARVGNVELEEVKSFVMELAKRLGVDSLLDKYPFEISGGQQQRINIIRALSLKPKLLLCDEPTGNLDSQNSKIVSELLIDLARKQNTSLVVVTHDPFLETTFDRVHTMVDGQMQ